MAHVSPLATSLALEVKQFRLLSAGAMARLASSEFPVAVDYADLLDGYHHFLMLQYPAGVFERSPTPFGMSRRGGAWVQDEKSRLSDLWRTAWEASPLENVFALAYWSVAQYDGLRAAVWLEEVFGRLDEVGDFSGMRAGLSSIIDAYRSGTAIVAGAVGPAADLYGGLQLAADSIQRAVGGESPLRTIDRYRPRPLW